MLKSKSFLAIDFGAGTLKLAEFELNEAGGLRLKQYGMKSLGAEGAQESAREAAILKALPALLNEKAIKADIVEGLFRVTEAAGLHLQLTDVSPAALCNAFRYNYGELEDCTMLLDIGAKTSNLLFFEKGKVFSRSINLGANAITQDFANESKLKFDDAERIKVAEGFVSLGGAYEEPDNPYQAAISKIARQFMTKLHIQVNQTLQFYRGQQGGSAPQRLFLSGGASVMPYAAQFFAEKLNVPVEYFNPLRNVQ